MKKISTLVIAIVAIAFTTQAQNTWTQKADFGGAVSESAVGFSIGSKGYIGTGHFSSKEFWEYDPFINAWTQKADFGGEGRLGAVGFSIGSKGYIGTGWDVNNNIYKNDFWEYDPSGNTWTMKADFSGTARVFGVGFSIGSKGYLGLGVGGNTDFWEYDQISDTWTQKADFGGTARWWAVGFSISNKGYIGTGCDPYTKNDFWEYDPISNLWTQKNNFGGIARYQAVGFSIGGKGYIGTGFDSLNLKNDFWEYDPATDNWTQKANFGGTARSTGIGFSIDTKGYIGIGFDGIDRKDFWEYTPESALTITTDVSISHNCPGTPIDVQFTAADFNAGNIFTAQLSDASGSFTNPTNIGSLSASSSGIIEATIPSSTPTGQHYRIRVVASDPVTTGTDNGSDITITCPKPKGLFVKHVTSTKATLSWHEGGCNATFTFAFRKAGTNYWSTLNTSYDFMILNGLMPSSTYFWKVRTVCAPGVSSEWSSKESFNTLPVKLEDASDDALESLNLFPNPTAGTFTLNLKLDDEENSEAAIQVLNMLGQVVYDETTSVANGVLQKEIQLSDAAAEGMYLVKVIVNEQVYSSQINYQK